MKYLKYLFPISWMCLIFFLSSRTDLPHANTYFWEFLFKKSGHVFVYFVLLLSWLYALGTKQIDNAIIYTLSYAFTDEVHQLFVPGRTGMLRDILVDCLGISLGILFYYFYTWKKPIFPQVQKIQGK